MEGKKREREKHGKTRKRVVGPTKKRRTVHQAKGMRKRVRMIRY
jgi:hypothetical protein